MNTENEHKLHAEFSKLITIKVELHMLFKINEKKACMKRYPEIRLLNDSILMLVAF